MQRWSRPRIWSRPQRGKSLLSSLWASVSSSYQAWLNPACLGFDILRLCFLTLCPVAQKFLKPLSGVPVPSPGRALSIRSLVPAGLGAPPASLDTPREISYPEAVCRPF